MLPLALGTQTAGSVIRPASFCGCAAVKPSFRLIPTVGVKTYSWALDTVGLFAAGVADVAHALALVTGRPEIERAEAGSAPRIAVVRQDFAGDPEPDAEAALTRARQAAERSGARASDLVLPQELAQAWERHRLIQNYEAGWRWPGSTTRRPTRSRPGPARTSMTGRRSARPSTTTRAATAITPGGC